MITFREFEDADARLVLDWRTKERVTKFMVSDIPYDLEAQKRWIAHSFSRPNYYHWIIQHNGRDVGVLNFSSENSAPKEAVMGFYIGEDDALGVGSFIPLYFYGFAFRVLGFDCVNVEVFYNNLNTIQLHLAQGQSFNPAGDHVVDKNGTPILVVCMSLEKESFIGSPLDRGRVVLPTQKWLYGKEEHSA